MIQPPLYPLSLNPRRTKRIKHLLRNLRTSHIRIFLFIIVAREAIETILISANIHFTNTLNQGKRNALINQIRNLRRIHLDRIPRRLPMRREDHHSARLDLCRDLAAYLAELFVGGVVDLVHDVWLGSLATFKPG